jgi:pimeloyl-ACP methyl ester carboxylesterase
LNVDLLLGHPSTFSFPLPEGGTRAGLFFPGLRGAPTIVLCHGYRSQRADILTMVSTMQNHGYNVFLFDFAGHGANPGSTTLGYRETGEVLAAIRTLAQRDDVDQSRFGAWGIDLGGYTTLSAAESDARIRAVAIDSAYDSPFDLLNEQVDRSGLEALPLLSRFCRLGFRLFNYSYRHVPPVSAHLVQLRGVAKLFIVVRVRTEMARSTLRLFALAPEPRQQVEERETYAEMSDEERRSYENRIVDFFLDSLPPAPPRSR